MTPQPQATAAAAGTHATLTFLFTDIEGSSQLWELHPEPMRRALAWHDALLRQAVEENRGRLVKRTGDGVHAAFDDACDAVAAAVAIQQRLQATEADLSTDTGAMGPTAGLSLRVRCGLHAGPVEARDGDYYGTDVNRAARIMGAAHGGQILLSAAVVGALDGQLRAGWQLRPQARVRLRGFAQAEPLTQIDAPGLREQFPPLRAQAETPHNLPALATRFFNRRSELADLGRRLVDERLVTLHGLGGMGKTRLALEAARGSLGRFADGVWFVELAQTTDPTLVPLAVAAVLGVKEEAGRSLLEGVVQTLADWHALLVLDNCEQVVDACADLADRILARAPGVHLLVTSREMLRLTAESVVEVEGFELPREAPDQPLPEPASVDAFLLFADRVRAVQAGFELDAQIAPTVATICRRLDGIPLALELAAAATRRMPLVRLAERLEDRLGTLVHGQRTAPARQKTLRALIDWSHDLLDPAQQRLFQRLSVFAGGWTLDAAEAVCADPPALPREAVMDALGELVEKSLVRLDPASGRYSQLDTVRQYAGERLAQDAAGLHEARRRHLAHYLGVAETARQHQGGPQQLEGLRTLDIERDNLLVAHQSCDVVSDGATTGVRLNWALKPYWIKRGLLGLGLRLGFETLGRLGPQAPADQRAAALADVGQVCVYAGQYAAARTHLEACLALARSQGDTRLEAAALQPLGMACLAFGDTQAATEHLEAALRLSAAAGNRVFQAYVESAYGPVLRVGGRFDDASAVTRAARAVALEHGDGDLEAITWLNEAMIRLDAGAQDAIDEACDTLASAVDACIRAGAQSWVQSALEVGCAIACEQGDHDAAAEFWSWAEAMARSTGLVRDPADERFIRPRVERLAEALGRAVLHRRVRDAVVQPADAALSRLQTWMSAVAEARRRTR